MEDRFQIAASHALTRRRPAGSHALGCGANRLALLGVLGQYGFYEAVDYTPARLPSGQSRAVVRSARRRSASLMSEKLKSARCKLRPTAP